LAEHRARRRRGETRADRGTRREERETVA
jgi:hypothetical protein